MECGFCECDVWVEFYGDFFGCFCCFVLLLVFVEGFGFCCGLGCFIDDCFLGGVGEDYG